MRSKGAAGDFFNFFSPLTMFLFHFQRNVIDFFTPKRSGFFSYSQISAWENIFSQLPQISTWENKYFPKVKWKKITLVLNHIFLLCWMGAWWVIVIDPLLTS